MWGTDLTTTITGQGRGAVFVAVDHHSAEVAARALALRHDHGSQSMAGGCRKALRLLGIAGSPVFVRAPEGNGCAGRFIHTLKENLLRVRRFDSVEKLRVAPIEFRETCNTTWLIERHGFRPPAAIRNEQLHPVAMAAEASARCLTTEGGTPPWSMVSPASAL